MRFLVLLLVWITPAVIAGMLGWKGIWGGNSAFADYLVPIPVAGGVFHVPSFIIAALVILNLKNLPETLSKFIPLIAIGIFLAAQTLQIDFDRLNAWFFTDYTPASSVIDFGKNPLYLFVATDAICVAIYAIIMGYSIHVRYLFILILIPGIIIGLEAFNYKTSGPVFTYGFSNYGKIRGDQTTTIFTPKAYDAALFTEWLTNESSVAMPWNSPNAEHLAVFFTNSMQAVKWHDATDVENIVGTVCVFEEDRLMVPHPEYYDCFAERLNLVEKIQESSKEVDTGLGKLLDDWLSRAVLCEGVVMPDNPLTEIALFNMCRRISRQYSEYLERFINEYGEDSEQVRFLITNRDLVPVHD